MELAAVAGKHERHNASQRYAIVSSSPHTAGLRPMKITTTVTFCASRLACLCLASVLVSCAPQAQRMPSPGPTAADAAFEGVSRRYFDEVMALTPVAATGLGDHRFDDKLDDVGAAGRERRVTLERELLGS